jgi:hypothetical protein
VTQPQQQDPVVAQIAAAASGAAVITQGTAAVTTNVIQALWRRVNPYNKREVAQFAKQAGQIMVSSQRTVANAHAAAQQLQLQALGINQPVTVTIPDNVRGATVDFAGKTPKVHAPTETKVNYDDGAEAVKKVEATPERLFERAAETYRYEKSTGKDTATANNIAEERIAKLVDNNMILSARLAQQQTLKLVSDKDARVVGYRRIIHPELSKGGVCGMCVAASDRVYKVEHLRPIHNRCHCTIAPVVKMDGQTHDPGHTLNQDDLDRLYQHAAEAAPGQRATSAAALKKTRYQIVDHHELGPVLTRVTGEPVPYAQAA